MPTPVRGFPRRFPVRDDGRRSLRYRVVSVLCRLFFRGLSIGGLLHIEGEEHIPPTGPALVVVNHLSNLDPLLFGGFFPGTLWAMGKREIFAVHPVGAWIMAGCNSFPVDRGTADRAALRTATEILGRGGRLLLFVEGTRAETLGMRRAEPGAGFLLRHSDAAIVPCAVWGTEKVLRRGHRFPRRARITMRYGPPVAGLASTSRDIQALSDRMALEIARLLPEQYRGEYADEVRRSHPPASP